MPPRMSLSRTIGVALRTAHVFTMAVYVGGVWFGGPEPLVEWWRAFAFGTGLGLLWTELDRGPGWISQARGLATISHVIAVALVGWGAGRTGTTLAVVIGALGSHAPQWVRTWSLKDGRTVE